MRMDEMKQKIISMAMSELGKKSGEARRKKYGNFGRLMKIARAKKRSKKIEILRHKKISPVSTSNGLTSETGGI